MRSNTWQTATEEETIALGRSIAASLPRPAVVLLIGNLGAGKTTLAKGIVEGLGAASPDEVSSPTFTLIHEYAPGIWHIDLYRLETTREVASLGLDDLFDRTDGVVLLEWAERFPALLPPNRTEIHIVANPDDTRTIRLTTMDR
jgi:tRNA threonylcarbamoyladenosine biosynthesis protein TsaE